MRCSATSRGQSIPAGLACSAALSQLLNARASSPLLAEYFQIERDAALRFQFLQLFGGCSAPSDPESECSPGACSPRCAPPLIVFGLENFLRFPADRFVCRACCASQGRV